MKDNTARLQRAVGLLVLVVVLGAVWYALVEHFSPLDAIFMAVTTITTVGYQEQPLDTGGKIFTIVFILVGVGLAFYTIVALVEAVLVGEVAEALGVRREGRRLRSMEGHHILCGFGRVGQSIARELQARSIQFVIIDRDPSQQTHARELGYVMLQGDATEEAVLRTAGAPRARVLVAAADSDAGNTFVTLTARALNPALTIIARAASDAGARRMIAAGADSVISPYQIAGHRMALAAVQRVGEDAARVADGAPQLVEVIVTGSEDVVGKTVASALSGLASIRVLGVRGAEGGFIPGAADDHVLRAGERLMLYGAQHDIDALCADQGFDAILPSVQPGVLRSSLSVG